MKYQLHCPKCNHEFTYDNGYYDKNIARLGAEIQTLTRQLAEHNLLPKHEQKRRTDWWLRTKKKLAEKHEELNALKSIRKVCDQQIKHAEHHIFKRLVRERLGEKEYMELIAKADEELKAYQVSGLMLHEYTRANSKPGVTHINKLRD